MKKLTATAVLLLLGVACRTNPWSAPPRPNLVVVFADDLGYGDLGSYGASGWETPHLDRLAEEGVRLTEFYAAQPVCSASRAALLTGCYPNRIGISGALGPGAKHGLHPDETTLAELLKAQGYATAIFGKWHLGHRPEFLPLRHGFDEFYGIPYSNDMWPYHPESPDAWGDLPTLEGEAVVGLNTDQNRFTGDFTERAVQFIERHADEPFFVYLPHPMPHVPLHASDEFRGTSSGLYGDVVQEIDASVGRILATLERLELDENTWVVFTSDNGPWLSYGDHAGGTAGLREGKGTTFEGGVRVPCIMRWPDGLPAGRECSAPTMAIDLLPTVAGVVGAPLPPLPIDGHDVWSDLTGADSLPDRTYAFYYHRNDLEALRRGRWKLHFPHRYRSMEGRELGSGGIPGKYDNRRTIGLELFDLEVDPFETTDVSADNVDVLQELLISANAMRFDLGDKLTDVEGVGVREPGRVEAP